MKGGSVKPGLYRAEEKDSGSHDRRKKLVVVSLSGGTGRTADQVLNAALAQFVDPQTCLIQKSQVRDVRAARRIVADAADNHAIIVHTLVEPKIRDAVVHEAERRMVPVVDILGPVINLLTDHLQVAPRNQAGLSYELRKEQFDRIDSVDFTLGHDDGARLKTLADADVVLVGVSRVAKSVTCFYLAYRGIRAANVPIVLGETLPKELTDVDANRVIGLTMNVERLKTLRSARIGTLAYGGVENYVDRRQVFEELRYASDLMLKHEWRCIDVSYLSVEETAMEVLRLIDK